MLSRIVLLTTLIAGLVLPAWSGPKSLATENLSLSLKLSEVAYIDMPETGLQTSMQVTDTCPGKKVLCVVGESVIEFSVHGNTVIDITLTPDKETLYQGRRVALFTLKDGAISANPLMFDIILRLENPAKPWGNKPAPTMAVLTEAELLETSENWGRRVNLKKGSRRARIFLRPVFDFDNPDLIADPGTYIASINLSIATH